MAAKDRFHDAVKIGLQKQGWTITDDPLKIQVSSVKYVYIDLGAEKLIAAERQGRQIAVEIKTFAGTSSMFDFHVAIGQFVNYRYALMDCQPERELFLGIPADVYDDLFQDSFIQSVVIRSQIKLLIYNPMQEEIVQWIG